MRPRTQPIPSRGESDHARGRSRASGRVAGRVDLAVLHVLDGIRGAFYHSSRLVCNRSSGCVQSGLAKTTEARESRTSTSKIRLIDIPFNLGTRAYTTAEGVPNQ